jgi:1,4-dihydroxy-2-naphthoyl-CoA hydrolase
MSAPIWFKKDLALNDLVPLGPNTMAVHLGMEWVAVGDDFLKMRMPVNNFTKQPYGILHGGASCALAETVGSLASHFIIDTERYYCVGMEINANHVRSARDGSVTATCMPLHLGSTTHVWDIRIQDDNEKLICISRLTVAILKKP